MNMNISIGENIKRLRREKNITQEKLAELLSISCPAISKWERGETYPDITMLLPLASYFGVSTDELLGLDTVKNEAKIKSYEDEYKNLNNHGKYDEARKLVLEAYKDFPNDFRIIHLYIWAIIGDSADNSPEVILAHQDELISLCERILDECNIDFIRNGAVSMLAKIYKAQGNIEKALEAINRFPSWYGCVKGQECERLFEKGTEDWWYWINRNMFDLSYFVVDKVEKTIWFSDMTFDKKLKASERVVQYLLMICKEAEYEPTYMHILNVYATIAGKCIRAGRTDEAIKYYDIYFLYAKKFDDFMASDRGILNAPDKIKSVLVADWGSSNKYNQVKRMISLLDGSQMYEELRKNDSFNVVLKKYRPYAKDIK
jgi:transcriptional regulator with XRE-family HTH domain